MGDDPEEAVLFGRGFGAETLQGVGSFGLAYMTVVLLEPLMSVEVVAPEEYLGEVLGDLTGRRGEIQGMDLRSGSRVIQARVPLAKMFGYATNLRSITQGRATFTMQFAEYGQVPRSLAEEIRARAARC